MANDLSALYRQCPSSLRIVPIETNHDTDLGDTDIPHQKAGITRREELGLFVKEMGFSITPQKPRRSHDDSRVVTD